MTQQHVVEPGEHISGIAARFGFGDFHRIWDDPANAELKKRRGDPHVLMPGDVLTIPDREEGIVEAVTTDVTTLEVDDLLLFLPLKVRDLGNKPLEKAPFELRLQLRPEPATGETAKDGLLVEEVARRAREGELRIEHKLPPLQKGEPDRVETFKFDLHIGALNPITTFSGQQQRLNNLGYPAGFSVDDIEQMQWAVEEFQLDHLHLHPPRKPPEILPESPDPLAETGVQHAATRKKLEELHGI
ncbi:MAG: peptidoglycan-binding domain-containing protein [Planctomycetota bacterium]